MEKQKVFRTLDFETAACIWFAAAVLFVPLRWVLCWLTAAIVHELFHYGMILLTGGSVHHIRIGVRGAVMHTQFQSWGREVLCAAAGPVGGLLLLFFARWAPELALCGLIQSAYNLIPVYPFDGGRVVGGLLRWLVPRWAESIINWTTIIALCLICIFGICGSFLLELGWLPVVFVVSILLQTGKIKIPCKQGRMGVQ